MSKFTITEKTEITRLPKRGVYDKDQINTILDEALFCTPCICERSYDRSTSVPDTDRFL